MWMCGLFVQTMVVKMNIRIEQLDESEEELWDEYVLSSEKSTFFHHLGWKKVIENVYGFPSYYLVAKINGTISGVLPLFEIDKKLISLPFTPYGGPLANNNLIASELLKEAKTIVQNKRMKYFNVRCSDCFHENFLTTETPYSTFLIRLDHDPAILWRNTSKSARRLVKKAINLGVTTEMNSAYLQDFYSLYARVNKEFGTPVHSFDFFDQILQQFYGKSIIQVAKYGDKIIGAKFLLFHKTTIVSGWAVTQKEYRKLSPNGVLTWDILQYGCKNNYKIFDFGRSEWNTGSFNFKQKWGEPQIQPIFMQYFMNRGGAAPNISRLSVKGKLFSRIWRSVPLTLSIKIGPYIRRHIP
jgi:serine/alanine adding enzyme